MRSKEVTIVRTGVANIASITAAFKRLKAQVHFTDDGDEILKADYLVLPGVGAFTPAIESLKERNLVGPLRERIFANRPTLGICLGMQLFFEKSEEVEEGYRVERGGLRMIPGTIEEFPSTVRVPQLGWNRVDASVGCKYLQTGYAYFANSYRLPREPRNEGWLAAKANYGGSFVAALERGNILVCQFHPELSGKWGHELLKRWINESEVPSC